MPTPAAALQRETPASEAVSALMALGYKTAEAERMIRQVEVSGSNSEELIRAALKAAAKQ